MVLGSIVFVPVAISSESLMCTAFIDCLKRNGTDWLLHAWQSQQELHSMQFAR